MHPAFRPSLTESLERLGISEDKYIQAITRDLPGMASGAELARRTIWRLVHGFHAVVEKALRAGSCDRVRDCIRDIVVGVVVVVGRRLADIHDLLERSRQTSCRRSGRWTRGWRELNCRRSGRVCSTISLTLLPYRVKMTYMELCRSCWALAPYSAGPGL